MEEEFGDQRIDIFRKSIDINQVISDIRDGPRSSVEVMRFGSVDDGSMDQIPPSQTTPAVLDFANKALGGLVLTGGGYLQEEVLFHDHPELFVTILICASMIDSEAVVVRGALQYCRHRGYSGTFEFNGSGLGIPLSCLDPITESMALRLSSPKDVICIDAAVGARGGSSREVLIHRDIGKLFAGFSCAFNGEEGRGISTGNWGCGAFGGNKTIKASIQLLVSSIVGKEIFFHTFGDQDQVIRLNALCSFCLSRNLTVSQLFQHIMEVVVPRAIEDQNFDPLEIWSASE